MELPKLFVAIGISLMLVIFFNNALSVIYDAPKLDYSKCGSSFGSASCYEQQKALCEANDYNCLSAIYSSQGYNDCVDRESEERQECMEEQGSELETYQIIYFLILAVFGIFLIIFGFLIISKKSIGSGFIGGGVLILIFANLFAALSIFASSLTSAFTSLSLTGFAVSNSAAKTSTLSYLNILFSFIGLLVLILFAYFKLEKKARGGFLSKLEKEF